MTYAKNVKNNSWSIDALFHAKLYQGIFASPCSTQALVFKEMQNAVISFSAPVSVRATKDSGIYVKVN